MNPTELDGWNDAQLADVARRDAPIGYGIVQPGSHVPDGVPVLAIRDLANPSTRTAHRSATTIEAAYSRSRIRGGDVLISVKGTTGRVGIVPAGFEGNISRDVARIRLRDEHDPGFWRQMLQSAPAQRILQQAAVGSTRQEISIGTLKKLRFRFPCRQEQVRIAALLADADELIAALEKIIGKRKMIRQGLLQQLATGRTRLTGFDESWLDLTIRDIATIEKGEQLGRSSMDSSYSYPVWNGGIVPSGFTASPNVRRPVVTVSEGGNSCGWVGRPTGAFWLGGHCYALEPKRFGHSVAFLFYALKARESSLMALRVGSGLPNIQKKQIRGFTISVPTDPEEARTISGVLDDVNDELGVLRNRLDKAVGVKTGMMQELLTDRARQPIKGGVA